MVRKRKRGKNRSFVLRSNLLSSANSSCLQRSSPASAPSTKLPEMPLLATFLCPPQKVMSYIQSKCLVKASHGTMISCQMSAFFGTRKRDSCREGKMQPLVPGTCARGKLLVRSHLLSEKPVALHCPMAPSHLVLVLPMDTDLDPWALGIYVGPS